MEAVEAPQGLGERGARMWVDVSEAFELRVDELRVLEDACREIDLIDRMHCEQQDMPLTAKGSMGQVVAAPLLQELRAHRALLARLLGALRLPDDEEAQQYEGRERSAKARTAALARWGRAG